MQWLTQERDAALARVEALEKRRQRDLVEWYRLSTGVYDMRGQINALTARAERAERLIQQVEWDGGNEDFLGGWCPWCRGSREMMYGSSGHEPDCPAFGQQTQTQTGV